MPQVGIKFEKLPQSPSRKPGERQYVTYRRIKAQNDRRIARRIAGLLKGRV